jgi:hypothetical protein
MHTFPQIAARKIPKAYAATAVEGGGLADWTGWSASAMGRFAQWRATVLTILWVYDGAKRLTHLCRRKEGFDSRSRAAARWLTR